MMIEGWIALVSLGAIVTLGAFMGLAHLMTRPHIEERRKLLQENIRLLIEEIATSEHTDLLLHDALRATIAEYRGLR